MPTQQDIINRAERLVRQEVLLCVSHVVSTLANGYGADIRTGYAPAGRDLNDLIEQAFELASPVPDYEEAAREAGWNADTSGSDRVSCFKRDDGEVLSAATWAEACEFEGIEPYDWEVYEHWAVTEWLADKLIAHGEKVDKDFANLNVWARTTTGQSISMDSVIVAIATELEGKA